MYIKVRVRTEAKNDKVTELSATLFKIDVREKPEDNRANEKVRELLANHLKIAVGKVHIVNGHHKPSKLLEII